MELAHEFTVNTPIDRAWAVLTDVERIAPCMPGAELTEVDGDTYHGLVKVKVGPITAQYKGTASFVEKDEAAHRAVLKAAGRDARGQGNASATVTAVMTEQGDGTRVAITTDMTVSGRVAQFGRGVMADVTAKLLQQFVGQPRSRRSRTRRERRGRQRRRCRGAAGAGPTTGAAGARGAGPARMLRVPPEPGQRAARCRAAAGAVGEAWRGCRVPATTGVTVPGPPRAPRCRPAAPPRRPVPRLSSSTEGEPVRVVGLVLRSATRRTGQFFVRLFHRLTGRREG